jgi:hypothetical protein
MLAKRGWLPGALGRISASVDSTPTAEGEAVYRIGEHCEERRNIASSPRGTGSSLSPALMTTIQH